MVIQQTQAAIGRSVETAGEQYRLSVQQTGIEISNQVDGIARKLGEQVNEPIANLDTTVQRQLFAARALAQSLNDTAITLPQCVGNEGLMAISSFKAGIQSALAAIPLTDARPTTYYLSDPSSRIPFIVSSERFVGGSYAINLKGSALPVVEDYCLEGQIKSTKNGVSTPVPIIGGSDSETISVNLPKGLKSGQYNVTVSGNKKILGLCIGSRRHIGGLIEVVSPIVLTPKITFTPICERRTPVVQPFSDSCTNSSMSSGKVCPRTFVFNDPAVKFTGFNFRVDSAHSAGASATRSGEGVAVSASASKRSKRKGGTSRVGYGGELLGYKLDGDYAGKTVELRLPHGLRPGQSVALSFSSQVPPQCYLTSWRANAEDREQNVALPPAASDPGGFIQSRTAEISLEADLKLGRVTVSRPKNGCL